MTGVFGEGERRAGAFRLTYAATVVCLIVGCGSSGLVAPSLSTATVPASATASSEVGARSAGSATSAPTSVGSGAAPSAVSATPSAVAATPSALSSASGPGHPVAGGEIVFEDAGHDFQDTQIWVEHADGSALGRLVTDETTDYSASLSPDGGEVVFYAVHPASLADALADPNLVGKIMLVGVDGSGLHELETGNRANRCDANPEGDAWSPDSRRIVFTRVCFDATGNLIGTGLWTIGIDGRDPREVTRTAGAKSLGNETWAPHLEDHRAGWSPDGKRLAFVRIDTVVTPERSAIFTIGIDGKDLRQVTDWSLDANDPDWSPDGTAIVFNSPAEAATSQNIYTIHPDGTGLTKLTDYDEYGQATFHPSWSPDGSHILFSHSPSTDGWGDLFVMDPNGGAIRILGHTAIHENHAQWGGPAVS